MQKKTLKISVNLFLDNEFSINKNKPLSSNNIYKSNIKKPSNSDFHEHLYNSHTHKRNNLGKNSQFIESIVSPSRSSFRNNYKIQMNHNGHGNINLNQINTEIKENQANDIKRNESNKNSVISNKNLKISKIKINKKLNENSQSLSNIQILVD